MDWGGGGGRENGAVTEAGARATPERDVLSGLGDREEQGGRGWKASEDWGVSGLEETGQGGAIASPKTACPRGRLGCRFQRARPSGQEGRAGGTEALQAPPERTVGSDLGAWAMALAGQGWMGPEPWAGGWGRRKAPGGLGGASSWRSGGESKVPGGLGAVSLGGAVSVRGRGAARPVFSRRLQNWTR